MTRTLDQNLPTPLKPHYISNFLSFLCLCLPSTDSFPLAFINAQISSILQKKPPRLAHILLRWTLFLVILKMFESITKWSTLTLSILYFLSFLEPTQYSTKMALAKVTSVGLTSSAHLIFLKVLEALIHVATPPKKVPLHRFPCLYISTRCCWQALPPWACESCSSSEFCPYPFFLLNLHSLFTSMALNTICKLIKWCQSIFPARISLLSFSIRTPTTH